MKPVLRKWLPPGASGEEEEEGEEGEEKEEEQEESRWHVTSDGRTPVNSARAQSKKMGSGLWRGGRGGACAAAPRKAILRFGIGCRRRLPAPSPIAVF